MSGEIAGGTVAVCTGVPVVFVLSSLVPLPGNVVGAPCIELSIAGMAAALAGPVAVPLPRANISSIVIAIALIGFPQSSNRLLQLLEMLVKFDRLSISQYR